MQDALIGGEKKVLSRDCDGCTLLHMCSERYRRVGKDEKVYCPDGTAHLVDCGSKNEFSVGFSQVIDCQAVKL